MNSSITSSKAPEEARTATILGCKLEYIELDVDVLYGYECDVVYQYDVINYIVNEYDVMNYIVYGCDEVYFVRMC
jgi:hypothetical protein